MRYLVGAFLVLAAGCSSLIEEAKVGDEAAVQSLLRNGADVNQIDEAGCTALLYAAQEGYAPVVEALLDGGADMDALSPDGETPLLGAAIRGNTEVTDLLISRGANRSCLWYGLTAFQWAAKKGHVETVLTFLNHGSDVGEKSATGQTPLMYAAEGGFTDVVKLLLDRGADIHEKDSKGWQAVDYANSFRNRRIMSLVAERIKYHVGLCALRMYNPRTKKLVKSLRTDRPMEPVMEGLSKGWVIETDSPGLKRTLTAERERADEQTRELIALLFVEN